LGIESFKCIEQNDKCGTIFNKSLWGVILSSGASHERYVKRDFWGQKP